MPSFNLYEDFEDENVNSKIPITSLSFISSLLLPLRTYAEAALNIPKTTKNCTIYTITPHNLPVSMRIINWEINTRSYVLTLIMKLLSSNNNDTKDDETMVGLLRFYRGVIDFSFHVLHFSDLSKNEQNLQKFNSNEKHYIGISINPYDCMDTLDFRKVPFVLLEVILDTLSIPLIKKFWNSGPSSWVQNFLCNHNHRIGSGLFTQGAKYCLIRMLNRLLKNLSLNSQEDLAEFAGRISMALAAVFPLSERSAVNVLGAFHTENSICYETADQWLKHSYSKSLTLSSLNSAKNMVNEEKSVKTLTYEFYEIFWAIQRDFVDPQQRLLSVINDMKNSQNSPCNIGQEMHHIQCKLYINNHLNDFITSIEVIFKAFKEHPILIESVTYNETKVRSREVNKNMKNIVILPSFGLCTSPYFTSTRMFGKYLTNSQILHLQIRDPEIRKQIITQFVIISSYLSSSITEILEDNSNANRNTLKDACNRFLSSLNRLVSFSEELMSQIPPDGKDHIETLKWIITERESTWRLWKKNRCLPPIEKYAADMKEKIRTRNMLSCSKKNYIDKHSRKDTIDHFSIEAIFSLYSTNINIKEDLPSILRDMSDKYRPKLVTYLKEYVEALDPDAQIEDEYHPKNNKLFTWRAMRLMAQRYIGQCGYDGTGNNERMIRRTDGDFEGMVRKIWKEDIGKDIPGKIPDVLDILDENSRDGNTCVYGDSAKYNRYNTEKNLVLKYEKECNIVKNSCNVSNSLIHAEEKKVEVISLSSGYTCEKNNLQANLSGKTEIALKRIESEEIYLGRSRHIIEMETEDKESEKAMFVLKENKSITNFNPVLSEGLEKPHISIEDTNNEIIETGQVRKSDAFYSSTDKQHMKSMLNDLTSRGESHKRKADDLNDENNNDTIQTLSKRLHIQHSGIRNNYPRLSSRCHSQIKRTENFQNVRGDGRSTHLSRRGVEPRALVMRDRRPPTRALGNMRRDEGRRDQPRDDLSNEINRIISHESRGVARTQRNWRRDVDQRYLNRRPFHRTMIGDNERHSSRR